MIAVGDTVYMVSASTVSDWVVTEVTGSRHSLFYKLQKGSQDSFIVCDKARIGSDVFINKADALRELSKRKGVI